MIFRPKTKALFALEVRLKVNETPRLARYDGKLALRPWRGTSKTRTKEFEIGLGYRARQAKRVNGRTCDAGKGGKGKSAIGVRNGVLLRERMGASAPATIVPIRKLRRDGANDQDSTNRLGSRNVHDDALKRITGFDGRKAGAPREKQTAEERKEGG